MLGGRAVIHDILNLVYRCFVGRSQIRVKALSRRNSHCVFGLVLPLPSTLPLLLFTPRGQPWLTSLVFPCYSFLKLHLTCPSSRILLDYSRLYMASLSISVH